MGMGSEAFARHMLFVAALRTTHEDLRAGGRVCAWADDLSKRIRARLRASAGFSGWVRSRCVELCRAAPLGQEPAFRTLA
eukprot:14451549-Heterocapsa_arctica.AAC.1